MKSTSLFLSTAVLFSAVFANADSNADSDASLTGTYSDGKLYWVLKDYIGMEDGYFAAKLGSVGDYVWEQEGAKVYIGDDQMDPSEYQLTVTGHVNQLVVPNVPTECELTYDFAPADVTGSGPWALTMIATHSISEGKTRVLQVSYTVPNPKTTTKPASTTSPSQSNTAPVVTSTNPAVASTNPAVASTNPAVASTNPAVASTNPAVASTNSNTPTTTSSVSSNPEGSTTNNNVAPGNNVATNNNVTTNNTVATNNNAATGNNVATTVITITSCADHICTKKPVTTGVTVCTATENGVETIYTTYCPLSGATPATAAPVTTPATNPATPPATTLASVSQSQSYTPPAVATATGMAAAIEVKGAAFGAALIALVALM